jgi:hypothetical protein
MKVNVLIRGELDDIAACAIAAENTSKWLVNQPLGVAIWLRNSLRAKPLQHPPIRTQRNLEQFIL